MNWHELSAKKVVYFWQCIQRLEKNMKIEKPWKLTWHIKCFLAICQVVCTILFIFMKRWTNCDVVWNISWHSRIISCQNNCYSLELGIRKHVYGQIANLVWGKRLVDGAVDVSHSSSNCFYRIPLYSNIINLYARAYDSPFCESLRLKGVFGSNKKVTKLLWDCV